MRISQTYSESAAPGKAAKLIPSRLGLLRVLQADIQAAPARISHQLSTAAADPGMSTSLRSVGRLDVLSSTPAAPSSRAPCIHAYLHRLATKSGEKSGLNPKNSPIFWR